MRSAIEALPHLKILIGNRCAADSLEFGRHTCCTLTSKVSFFSDFWSQISPIQTGDN